MIESISPHKRVLAGPVKACIYIPTIPNLAGEMAINGTNQFTFLFVGLNICTVYIFFLGRSYLSDGGAHHSMHCSGEFLKSRHPVQNSDVGVHLPLPSKTQPSGWLDSKIDGTADGGGHFRWQSEGTCPPFAAVS